MLLAWVSPEYYRYRGIIESGSIPAQAEREISCLLGSRTDWFGMARVLGVQSFAVEPLSRAFDTSIVVPGSKSHTNRALICAGLAKGTSTLDNWLESDDTTAMIGALDSVGINTSVEERGLLVEGLGGFAKNLEDEEIRVFANRSGTTARFVLPLLAFSQGSYLLDGDTQLRSRPFDDQVESLAQLGSNLRGTALPIAIQGVAPETNTCSVSGEISSQFLSGLLLVAPALPLGLNIDVTTELVSTPYIELTLATMSEFGDQYEVSPDFRRFEVEPTGYNSAQISIEPDASAASYFMAAAAVSGSTVEIVGLHANSIQGDIRFAEILRQMGAGVEFKSNSIVVSGPPALTGVEVDMSDCSDVAQTLAVVAAGATTETTVTGIGFIRNKETNRIKATVEELRRCGVDAEESHDGFVVRPTKVKPARIRTYDDHRMAMSFSILGLTNAGINIEDPQCVEKTFPKFFETLNQLY